MTMLDTSLHAFPAPANTPEPKPFDGVYRLSDGTPAKKFRRYVAQLGQVYDHPAGIWDKPIVVTAEQRQHWLEETGRALTNGLSVKATKATKDGKHPNYKNPDYTIGDVVGLEVEGDWLAVVIQARGEDAIDLLERNKDVSPEFQPYDKDGLGNEYRDFIRAVCVVTRPVINSQPIAASLEGDAVVMLDRKETKTLSREAPMSKLSAHVAKVCGLAEGEAEEDKLIAALEAHQKKEREEMDGEKAAHKACREKMASLETEFGEHKGRAAKCSCGAFGKKLSRDIGSEVRGGRALITAAFKSGEITAVVRDKLMAEWDEAKLLSRDTAPDVAALESLLALFPDNKPVAAGSGTGAQTKELSREVPGGNAAIDPTATPKPGENPWTKGLPEYAQKDAK